MSIITPALERLGSLLANLPTWQNWAGMDAAEHIHLFQTKRQPPMPFCLIDIGDGFGRERVGLGSQMEQRGGLLLYLRDAVAADLSEGEAALVFCQRLDALWLDLERHSSLHAGFLIQGIQLITPPTRIDCDRRPHTGDFYEAVLGITFTIP